MSALTRRLAAFEKRSGFTATHAACPAPADDGTPRTCCPSHAWVDAASLAQGPVPVTAEDLAVVAALFAAIDAQEAAQHGR